MSKSSRRQHRRQPASAPLPASTSTLLPARGPKVYLFTPLKLFVGSLLLLGVGFAVGVFVQASVAPSPSSLPRPGSPPPIPSASPASPASVQLPSFGELQAVEQLKEHLQHAPDDLKSRIKLGHALFDMGNFREAIEHYQIALVAQPADPDVRTDMGIAYRNTGRSDQAAAAFRRAIQDAPRHLNAHYNLGVVLAFDLDDPAGAIAAWERYLELAPEAANRADLQRQIEQLKSRL